MDQLYPVSSKTLANHGGHPLGDFRRTSGLCEHGFSKSDGSFFLLDANPVSSGTFEFFLLIEVAGADENAQLRIHLPGGGDQRHSIRRMRQGDHEVTGRANACSFK
jgi:hypothetical protein